LGNAPDAAAAELLAADISDEQFILVVNQL
jgi:hypothetical protein